MKPEVGQKVGQGNTTDRLIPTCRDSTIEEVFADPSGRFHIFNLPLALHCGRSGGVSLCPNQGPWTVLSRVTTTDPVGLIMALESIRQILRLANIKAAFGILQNIDPKHEARSGSEGRAGKYNRSVNPDVSGLYH